MRPYYNEAPAGLLWHYRLELWDMLCDPHGDDTNSITDYSTDYVNFCEDTIFPTRSVLVSQQQAPGHQRPYWIKRRGCSGLATRMSWGGYGVNWRSCEGVKMHTGRSWNNIKEVWKGMKLITGLCKWTKIYRFPLLRAGLECDDEWGDSWSDYTKAYCRPWLHQSQIPEVLWCPAVCHSAASLQPRSAAKKGTGAVEEIMFSASTKESRPSLPNDFSAVALTCNEGVTETLVLAWLPARSRKEFFWNFSL